MLSNNILIKINCLATGLICKKCCEGPRAAIWNILVKRNALFKFINKVILLFIKLQLKKEVGNKRFKK